MAGSGPPPNPQSRKQSGSQAHTWTDLPSQGYSGRLPLWPLAPRLGDEGLVGALHARELEVWAKVWRTPQADVWARNGWTLDVAMYVRYLVAGECGDLRAATESRMWSDRLGLNPAAMLKNRWRVRVDEVAVPRTTKAQPNPKRRLKVVDDAVARS